MSTDLLDNGLQQELNSDIQGERIITPGISELARKSAAEGCVLLKNNGVLPLDRKKKVSLFGRCHVDTFLLVTAVAVMCILRIRCRFWMDCVAAGKLP